MFRPDDQTEGQDPSVEAEHGAPSHAEQLAEFMAPRQHPDEFWDRDEEGRSVYVGPYR